MSEPKKKLPTIEEMSGLIEDFTGGLTLKEYFAEMYDDYGDDTSESSIQSPTPTEQTSKTSVKGE